MGEPVTCSQRFHNNKATMSQSVTLVLLKNTVIEWTWCLKVMLLFLGRVGVLSV